MERHPLKRRGQQPMLEFGLERVSTVLCLGAHADDIEIGCGGILLKLAAIKPSVSVRVVVFSGRGRRAGEAREAARAFLRPLSRRRVSVANFTDAFFPQQMAEIK